MNAHRLKAELAALRARVDSLLEEITRDGEAANADAPERIWMSPSEYAERVGVSPNTVRAWVKQGLPSVKKSERKILIDVARADEWSPGDATDRAADRSAHGG